MTLPNGWHRWGNTPEGPRYRKREGSRVIVAVVRTGGMVAYTAHEHGRRWKPGGNMAIVHIRRVRLTEAEIAEVLALAELEAP